MAHELILMAEPREVHGKKVKALRREGLVPGVVYGPVVEGTRSVSVNTRDFSKFFMAHGHSTIFTLKWGDNSQQVLIREVQREPVRQDILHIDFFAPDMKAKLRQMVPVVLAHHQEVTGGMLQHTITEIEVEALPADLPNEILVDVSGLDHIGATITVADIEAIKKVDIITDPETTIASITAVKVETEEAEGEEVEAATEEAATETEETPEE